ncbi:hypothetical protein Tco_1467265 [Tanacetum coccineum]
MLLQKLITSSALVEDPSPVASTSRSLILGETDGLLSYKATTRPIALSNYHFSNWDIDSHLLFLLKERGLLPLSVALLSSSKLHSEVGQMGFVYGFTSLFNPHPFHLFFCRSGMRWVINHKVVIERRALYVLEVVEHIVRMILTKKRNVHTENADCYSPPTLKEFRPEIPFELPSGVVLMKRPMITSVAGDGALVIVVDVVVYGDIYRCGGVW